MPSVLFSCSDLSVDFLLSPGNTDLMARWIELYVLKMIYLLIGLSLLLTVFLGISIGLRNKERTVHTVLKYASIVVLVAVIAVAGLATIELLGIGEGFGGLFIALVLIPLALIGAYLHNQSNPTRINLLSTIAFSWGPSFILGLIVMSGVLLGIGNELSLAQTKSQEIALGILTYILGGGTVVAISVRLSSWVNPIVSSDTVS